MAHVPLALRLSLREGSIYYFTERKLTSVQPHFHIVVNDPLTQQVLLLTVVTSKIEKVKYRRRDCLETVVELSPEDFIFQLTAKESAALRSQFATSSRNLIKTSYATTL